MSCGCGNPAVDAILGQLPSELSPSMFNHLMMEAPRVFDEEIRVQADKSPSIFTGLLASRPFPTDQTEYSQIRLTRSSGIQFYNNREMFRKAYSPDNCAPGCTWDPKSFDAGREIVTSTLEVADFEQEVPCIDNMLKSYAFVEFFLTVPTFLKGYMEDIAAQYVRNELLSRAKKIILTNSQIRASAADPRCFPNMLDTNDDVMLLGDLNPSSLVAIYDELFCTHPDCEGFADINGYKVLGLMIDPIQWRLKQQTDPTYGDYITNTPKMASDFFERFMPTSMFAEMYAILPTKELPRADVDPTTGDVLYHHRYVDVPTGSGGVKRAGNPGFAAAEYGVALLVNSDLGFLWDEAPMPVTSIGDAKFGPQFGQKSMQNKKWEFLVNYDYDCNPLGKGGKYISQYKTGFHPGPGTECLYAILYPLTKYANVRSGLPEGECITAPAECADLFQDTGCPCPMVKFCCNISETQAVLKTDQDIGVAAAETFEVVYDDGVKQTVTADEVIEENGLFIYRVSSATAIRCACIKDFVCETSVVCSSKVLATSDCKQPTETGVQLESCFNAPVGTSLTVVYANGDEAVLPVTEISTKSVEGVDVTFHFVAASYEDVCQKGGIALVKLEGVAECVEVDAVIECTPTP